MVRTPSAETHRLLITMQTSTATSKINLTISKHTLTDDLAIPLLGIYPGEM